jgi:predicted DNA-binding transcriptional regulator AlpA
MTDAGMQALYDADGNLTGLLLSPALAKSVSMLALAGIDARRVVNGVSTDAALVTEVRRIRAYARRSVDSASSLSVPTVDSASELAPGLDLPALFASDLINTEEVRRMIGCGQSNVRDLVARRRLTPVKTGKRSSMFVRADVERYLQESAHRRSA